MSQHEFKVMEWLRDLRNKHSADIKDKSWDEIHRETQEASERMINKINEKRKQKQN